MNTEAPRRAWCSQCGLEIEVDEEQAGVVWLTVEAKDTAVGHPARAVCTRKPDGKMQWRHVPVETEEEAILGVLARGPGLKDRKTLDERLAALQREWRLEHINSLMLGMFPDRGDGPRG